METEYVTLLDREDKTHVKNRSEAYTTNYFHKLETEYLGNLQINYKNISWYDQ